LLAPFYSGEDADWISLPDEWGRLFVVFVEETIDGGELLLRTARRFHRLECIRAHVEGSALPKSVESGTLSLNKVGIRSMPG
jgi:hypothetical protein